MAKGLNELARGFRNRTLVTAKLAGRVGLKMAKRQLGGAGAEPNDAEVARATDAAKVLVEELGQLKGLVMKVGQMASFLPGALPQRAQDVLADLQAHTVAMEYGRVREVVEAEFGEPVEALFDEFEEEPFAAASIGQVHRARFRGRDVAVKVQYPDIEEVLASDLGTMGLITKLGSLGLPIDGAALVTELESRILEECDYELEARHQRELGAILREDAGAHVPEVVGERSGRRVLTSELVEALSFGDFAETASQAAKDHAGEVIFRSCFRSIFQHGVYNGDPHPGNYLFDADGRVTFLDFGSVRRFNEPFIETWKAFARSVIDDDRAVFPDRFRALGFVGRERGFDYDHTWKMFQYLYLPFMQTEPHFTYTDAYVRESYGLMLFDNPNQRRTAMPPEWLLLNRLQWGVNAVLAKLDATAPWPTHFRRAVTSPMMGHG